jgi:hypothetical protein
VAVTAVTVRTGCGNSGQGYGCGELLKTYQQKVNLEPKWGMGMRKI